MDTKQMVESIVVPPMPDYMNKEAQREDITIDTLIRLLEIVKEQIGGDEFVLFRDNKTEHIVTPVFPSVIVENTYDPINGEKLCHRVFIEYQDAKDYYGRS